MSNEGEIIETPSGGRVHVAAGIDPGDPTNAHLIGWARDRAEEDPSAYVIVGHCTPVERRPSLWRRIKAALRWEER